MVFFLFDYLITNCDKKTEQNGEGLLQHHKQISTGRKSTKRQERQKEEI